MGAQDDLNFFQQAADKVCESAEEAAKYVDAMMEKAGHKRVSSWIDNDTSDGKKTEKKSFWDVGEESTRRDIPRRQSGGSDWQYGGKGA